MAGIFKQHKQLQEDAQGDVKSRGTHLHKESTDIVVLKQVRIQTYLRQGKRLKKGFLYDVVVELGSFDVISSPHKAIVVPTDGIC